MWMPQRKFLWLQRIYYLTLSFSQVAYAEKRKLTTFSSYQLSNNIGHSFSFNM